MVGAVLCVAGQLVLYGLARRQYDAGRVWNRLVLGRELVPAWRVLTK